LIIIPGSKFTTCEGILSDLITALKDNPFLAGDSANPSHKETFDNIMDQLNKMYKGKQEFSLVLNDPLANSYIQNMCAPDDDPNLRVEEYERTFKQNEELGLNDMDTENYIKDEEDIKEEKEKGEKEEN
jgi:zinc finger protein